MTAVERMWAVVSKPRWSDNGIVSYRIDRLAWVLWLVDWSLWALATYTAFAGPVTVLVAALAGFTVIRFAANWRLRHVIRRLEATGNEDELAAARGCAVTGVRLLRRRLESGARRSDLKARKFEARAASKAGSYRAVRDAHHLRVRAHSERSWASEARNLTKDFE